MQGYVINGRIMTMAEEKAEKKKERRGQSMKTDFFISKTERSSG